jgi:hypothetical protein
MIETVQDLINALEEIDDKDRYIYAYLRDINTGSMLCKLEIVDDINSDRVDIDIYRI